MTTAIPKELLEIDLYGLLGTTVSASEDEIKKAYRVKVLKVHPDRNPDLKNADALFQQVKKAYDILTSAELKKAYDTTLHAKLLHKEKRRKLDEHRRNLQEDLTSREEAFKKQKTDKMSSDQRLEQEMTRLKAESNARQVMLEAIRRKRADEAAARAASISAHHKRDSDQTIVVKRRLKNSDISFATANVFLSEKVGALDEFVAGAKSAVAVFKGKLKAETFMLSQTQNPHPDFVFTWKNQHPAGEAAKSEIPVAPKPIPTTLSEDYELHTLARLKQMAEKSKADKAL